MTNQILSAEAKLLILKYGYRPVLEALAQSQGTTIEQVEEDLQKACEGRTKGRPKEVKTLQEILDDLRLSEQCRPLVRELGAKYESRIFLPTLREVTSFLERYAKSQRKPKSRREALRPVIDALASLSAERLQELLEKTNDTHGKSDYFLLAHEIMGKSPR